MFLKHLIFYLIVFCSLTSFYAQDLSDKYAFYIDKNDLKKHLEIVASDSFAGRETGYKGQKMAANYLINSFKNNGLQAPLGHNNFKQVFEVLETNYSGNLLYNTKRYSFAKDFIYLFADYLVEFNNSQTQFLGLLDNFCKHNLEVDISNKSVVLYAKKGISFKQIKDTYDKLKKRKAFAVFVILEDYAKMYDFLAHFVLESKMILNTEKDKKACPLVLTNSEHFNFGVDRLDNKEIKKWRKLKYLKKKYSGNISGEISNNAKLLITENVVAYIEGTDSVLKNELIVLTAHYDHMGVHDGEIYNGADDDGTGTVALLEIAQAFQVAKNQGDGPKRSILFMPVSGEEKGLLGSKYYTDNPIYPLKNTITNLNIDMIGRKDDLQDNPNYVYIIGSDMLSDDLHIANENAAKKVNNLKLDYRFNTKSDPNRFYYRSDHYNFVLNNIPSIFYFSGIHKDYHKPTDSVDKINYEKLEKTTKLVFHTAWILANAKSRPLLNE